jgi:hypothetical protein
MTDPVYLYLIMSDKMFPSASNGLVIPDKMIHPQPPTPAQPPTNTKEFEPFKIMSWAVIRWRVEPF